MNGEKWHECLPLNWRHSSPFVVCIAGARVHALLRVQQRRRTFIAHTLQRKQSAKDKSIDHKSISKIVEFSPPSPQGAADRIAQLWTVKPEADNMAFATDQSLPSIYLSLSAFWTTEQNKEKKVVAGVALLDMILPLLLVPPLFFIHFDFIIVYYRNGYSILVICFIFILRASDCEHTAPEVRRSESCMACATTTTQDDTDDRHHTTKNRLKRRRTCARCCVRTNGDRATFPHTQRHRIQWAVAMCCQSKVVKTSFLIYVSLHQFTFALAPNTLHNVRHVCNEHA